MKDVEGRNGGTIKRIEKGESGNPNGRPPKIKTVLRNLYIDTEDIRLSDSQIKEMLRGYVSKSETEIAEIMKDPNVPMALKAGFKLMSAQLKKGNDSFYKWIFEMQVGKAAQKQEHTGGTNADGTDKPIAIENTHQLPEWLKNLKGIKDEQKE